MVETLELSKKEQTAYDLFVSRRQHYLEVIGVNMGSQQRALDGMLSQLSEEQRRSFLLHEGDDYHILRLKDEIDVHGFYIQSYSGDQYYIGIAPDWYIPVLTMMHCQVNSVGFFCVRPQPPLPPFDEMLMFKLYLENDIGEAIFWNSAVLSNWYTCKCGYAMSRSDWYKKAGSEFCSTNRFLSVALGPSWQEPV